MNSPEEKIILLIGLSKNCLACTLTKRSANYTDIKAMEIRIQNNIYVDSE